VAGFTLRYGMVSSFAVRVTADHETASCVCVVEDVKSEIAGMKHFSRRTV
jgi:hypothetical protein